MILPFSTNINGNPTYFVEKILAGLLLPFQVKYITENNLLSLNESEDYKNLCNYIYDSGQTLGYISANEIVDQIETVKPKLHTIRDDKNNRWQVGTNIDFFINVRQKSMFRFAPRVDVVSTQEVYMTHKYGDVIEISIDDKYLVSYTERLEFAINDGFDNWEGFFNYFYPKIKSAPGELYKPKLIHWTDLKY